MRALFGGAERPSNPMRKTRHRGGRHYSCMVDRHSPTPLIEVRLGAKHAAEAIMSADAATGWVPERE